jgi:nickel-dependent lactate racemase
MVEVWLPFGKTEVCTRIPTPNYLGTIEPKEKHGVPSPKAEIERAIKDPAGTERLNEMVNPNDKVAIVVDEKQATPSHFMVNSILTELKSAGVRDGNITIIFAYDARGAVELSKMKRFEVGEAELKKVKIINHDCKSEDKIYLGTTSFGTEVHINKVFAEADIRILTGDIGLHCYAGYRGGRMSVLPGVSGELTIQNNHAMFIHPKAEMGILEGNPVHEDMVEAARLAKVDFTINVVLNRNREIIKAFAGDLEHVFYEGVKIVDEMCRVPIARKAGIVVVSSGGYPFDVSLYQAYKGIHSALNAVKKGGVILLVAECIEGHGHPEFYKWIVKFKNLQKMERELKRRFVIGGHKAYYLKRALKEVQIILVSVMPDYYAVNAFDLRTARAVNDALRGAFDIVGNNEKVWAMPYGNVTLPIVDITK